MPYRADDRLRAAFSVSEAEIPSGFVDALKPRRGLIPELEFVRSRVDCWRFYHFHDAGAKSPMKTMTDLHDNRHLRAEGSNLAAFLFLLSKKHPNEYSQIRQTVRLAAPLFDDFVLQPSRLNEEKILLE